MLRFLMHLSDVHIGHSSHVNKIQVYVEGSISVLR